MNSRQAKKIIRRHWERRHNTAQRAIAKRYSVHVRRLGIVAGWKAMVLEVNR